jgi:hypothetical protein
MPRKAKEQQTMANWKLEGTSVVWDEDAPDPVADAFDPSKHNIEDVKKYVTDHPDQVQAVYDAEAEGKNRSSLLDWLTAGG